MIRLLDESLSEDKADFPAAPLICHHAAVYIPYKQAALDILYIICYHGCVCDQQIPEQIQQHPGSDPARSASVFE